MGGLSSCVWVQNTFLYLGDLVLSEPSMVAHCNHTRRQDVCVFDVAPCAAITVISHQSEAAEPHIDIPDCLPACLFGKNRYVKRQALPLVFFPRTVCLSWWGEKKEKVSGLCQRGWERVSMCGGMEQCLGKWGRGGELEMRRRFMALTSVDPAGRGWSWSLDGDSCWMMIVITQGWISSSAVRQVARSQRFRSHLQISV